MSGLPLDHMPPLGSKSEPEALGRSLAAGDGPESPETTSNSATEDAAEVPLRELTAPKLQRLPETGRTVWFASVAIGTVLSAWIGVIYWAAQGWILGATLSLFVPGFGLISVLVAMSQ